MTTWQMAALLGLLAAIFWQIYRIWSAYLEGLKIMKMIHENEKTTIEVFKIKFELHELFFKTSMRSLENTNSAIMHELLKRKGTECPPPDS